MAESLALEPSCCSSSVLLMAVSCDNDFEASTEFSRSSLGWLLLVAASGSLLRSGLAKISDQGLLNLGAHFEVT